MAPAWSFDLLTQQEKSSAAILCQPMVLPRSSPFRQYTYSRGVVVQSPNDFHPRIHLLGLPVEIRNIIWENISHAITEQSDQCPFHRPKDDFDGLLLACRQTYIESRGSWHRFTVAWPRLQSLLETRLNRSIVKQYTSLSLEIRLDAHPGYFTGLAAVLFKAQPYLRELRLYFIGCDQYGSPSYTHGCGTLDKVQRKAKLPIDGQRLRDFPPLWKRIAALSRLETLVISNANFQVFEPVVLANKSCLKYLCLSTDPRSVAHKQHNLHDLGFLLTSLPHQYGYPPVKVLHIAANATLSSNSLAARVAETLEHLTWVVPDPAMQSCGIDQKYHQRTAELMHALRRKAAKLHTLRMCIDGAGIYDDASYGNLIGGIKIHLPHFQRLKHFEIHFKSKSYWLGKEIIARLPNSLENLYLTDCAIHPTDLLHQIWERYLAPTHADDHDRGILDVTFTRTAPVRPSINEQCSTCPPILPLHEDQGPWLISHGPRTKYDTDRDSAGVSESQQLIYRYRSRSNQLFQPGYYDDYRYIHGYRQYWPKFQGLCREFYRQDFIPFHTGSLRFVHYEYRAPVDASEDEDNPGPLFVALLINGRLLDKERNKHLAPYNRGQSIPPRCGEQKAISAGHGEGAMRSNNLSYAVLLHQLYEIETTNPRECNQYLTEFDESSHLQNDERYFGNEDEAVSVFNRERIASPESLPFYRYPVELPVPMDERCHWMSPEAIGSSGNGCKEM